MSRSRPQIPDEPEAAPRRMFEFADGKSNKFWEVWRDGTKVTTRWGRIGTNGQEKVKELASPEKATTELEKLIAEKLRKGYRAIEAQPAQSLSHETAPAAGSQTRSRSKGAESAPLAASRPPEDGQQNAKEVATGQRTAAVESQEVRPIPTAQKVNTNLFNSEWREIANHPSAAYPQTVGETLATSQLVATTKPLFDPGAPAEAFTEELTAAGFERCGDFIEPDLKVHVRGMWKAPNVFAAVSGCGGFHWVEICVFNADGT